MSTVALKNSAKSNKAALKASASKSRTKTGPTPTLAPVTPSPTRVAQTAVDETSSHKTTKQERVLALLSRADGACIAEMMEATNWQQHSVRGFLAGTVKKKLGFSLISSKAADDVRRYRIKTRRGS
jgi:hypothetical protein